MKQTAVLLLSAAALLALGPVTADAGGNHVTFGARIGSAHHGWGHHDHHYDHHWRHRGHRPRVHWRGTVIFGPWYPYRYYHSPPVVIREEAPVYIQPEPKPSDYWYYCQDPQGYYPYVRSCPGGWMKVVPDTTPPDS